MPASPAPTLGEALARAARDAPDKGITLFDGRGRRSEARTWPELLESARRGAGRLAALGVGPGDRVVVALPADWTWFESWLGSLLLGAWPVASAPAGAMGAAEAQVRKLDGVLDPLAPRCVVARDAFREEAERLGASRLAASVVTVEELADLSPSSSWREARPDPEETAYLQLTSGSTGRARGVVVTHRGAIHNTLAIDEAIGAPFAAPASRWADALVAWLPLHHDMGLVGCLFHALLGGFDLCLLPARAFLARPRLWLENLSRRGRTFGPAPNFGYQLCVERVSAEERAGLDLSGWRAGMVGAEMIRPETLAAFHAAFGPRGLAPGALRPCYGLAEATLAVTVDRVGEGLRTRPVPSAQGPRTEGSWGEGARGAGEPRRRVGEGGKPGTNEVVCVGAPVEETEVRVTAPDGAPRPDGEVGEVRVAGPAVCPAYYGDPEATAETFDGGWLKTGDLGFLAGGELYLTGRTKDLIIVRGQNLMPHELEWVAEAVTGGGGVARSGAFAVGGGAQGEQAVLVLETEERQEEALAQLDREVRLRVARSLSLPLADVVFVRRGRIPKTTSGKVQRGELRQRYLEGRLERLGG